MHALSHQEIRQLAGDPWTFQKGLDYYFAGRVRSVVMEKEGRFHARVQGTRLYHVKATFKGDTFSAYCDCPAFAGPPASASTWWRSCSSWARAPRPRRRRRPSTPGPNGC